MEFSHSKKASTLLTEMVAMMVALMFSYTAISKLMDWEGTRNGLYNQVFPIWTADLLLYVLPAIELAAAAMLLIPYFRYWGLVISTWLMGSFSLYIGVVMTGMLGRIPCSCGGVIQSMSWSLHLLFNLFFLGISLSGYLLERNALARAQMGLFKA
ncbi:MauE/DoxX family redox-associated membrane protein [Anditalea andensis]|nr:MauE/DoxX family redox-associated membrane protein [Anditalea andensis]